ncbi:hypothetical protein ASG76_15095 [Nocardioides sp. Soil774]|uniref:hypothetical protein n=1 Tax=Nocardioides sp. Soil774 TaxID=1736408 RepID=UPI0006F5F0D9|nr:hypothetical protein [Nocardioides sp. Soil774]KRE92793.1 hypothetical protein ASG76_15095 [Nocardioides sp. Soil774]
MTLIDTHTPSATTALPVPSRSRRAVLVLVGLLNCALPTVFTLNITRMLLTGELSEHRYHQLTGQGEILFALWLVPIVLMLRAGWRGRRPAAATGLHHLVLIGTGVVAATLAPGGGAPFLVAVVTVTGALLWAALPARPRLRLPLRIDPLLAPLALVGSALLVAYAIDQLALQDAATTGFHSSNPHFFDQAWIALTLAAMGLLAALLPAARRSVRWVALALVVLGGAGLALGEGAPVHGGLLVLGAVTGLADLAGRRSLSRN